MNQLAILRPILENLPDSEEGQEPQLPVTPVYRTPMGGGDYRSSRAGQSISPAGSTPSSSALSDSTATESDGMSLSDCSKKKNAKSSGAHSFVHVSF